MPGDLGLGDPAPAPGAPEVLIPRELGLDLRPVGPVVTEDPLGSEPPQELEPGLRPEPRPPLVLLTQLLGVHIDTSFPERPRAPSSRTVGPKSP